MCDLETEGAEDPLKMPIASTTALAFSSDGRILAAASRLTDRILLWDVAARRERPRLRGHSSPVLSLAFAPDGRSLASGGGIGDQAIIVWDLATGGQRLRLVTPGFVTALAYSPDGSLLASANGFPGGPLHIWDPAAGRLVRSIGSRSTSRNPMAFAPGGRLLATADEDGIVKFWSVTTGRRLASLDGQADFLRGVAFSPDGRTLAAIGNDDDVRLWDAAEVIGDPDRSPSGSMRRPSTIWCGSRLVIGRSRRTAFEDGSRSSKMAPRIEAPSSIPSKRWAVVLQQFDTIATTKTREKIGSFPGPSRESRA